MEAFVSQLPESELALKNTLRNELKEKLERRSIDIQQTMQKLDDDGLLLNDFVVPVSMIRFAIEQMSINEGDFSTTMPVIKAHGITGGLGFTPRYFQAHGSMFIEVI